MGNIFYTKPTSIIPLLETDGNGKLIEKNSEYYLEEIMNFKEKDFELYTKYILFLNKAAEKDLLINPLFLQSMTHPNFSVVIKKNGYIVSCRCSRPPGRFYDIIITSKEGKEVKDSFLYDPDHDDEKRIVKWWKPIK